VSDRTEFPTESRLAELRSRGEVPWSRLSTLAVRSVVLLLILGGGGSSLGALIAELSAAGAADDPAAVVRLALREGGMLVLIPTAALLVTSLVWLLFQTRFLFLPARLSPSLSRLAPFRSAALRVSLHRRISAALLLVLALGAALAAAWLAIPPAATLLNTDRVAFAGAAGSVLGTALPVLLGVGMFLALFGFFLARFLFRWRHRMSRAEVLREERAG